MARIILSLEDMRHIDISLDRAQSRHKHSRDGYIWKVATVWCRNRCRLDYVKIAAQWHLKP